MSKRKRPTRDQLVAAKVTAATYAAIERERQRLDKLIPGVTLSSTLRSLIRRGLAAS